VGPYLIVTTAGAALGEHRAGEAEASRRGALSRRMLGQRAQPQDRSTTARSSSDERARRREGSRRRHLLPPNATNTSELACAGVVEQEEGKREK
jgi:hypothetical protein